MISIRIPLNLLVFFCLFSSCLASSQYYDDFSEDMVNPEKWPYCMRGTVKNGQLWLNLYGENSWQSTSCRVAEENITNHLSSLVAISSDSYATPGSSVAVKIGGTFYNDTYDGSAGYNNWEGNVFADVRLQLFMGEIYARVVVVRYNNASGSSKTPLSKFFQQPIHFDTQYFLSIEHTGQTIVFKCNDETIVYPIKTPTYPSNKSNRRLISMVYADIGERGYASGFFDDVCLTGKCSKAKTLPSIYHLLRRTRK